MKTRGGIWNQFSYSPPGTWNRFQIPGGKFENVFKFPGGIWNRFQIPGGEFEMGGIWNRYTGVCWWNIDPQAVKANIYI